jgi:UDP-glucose 4-epimerase
MKVIVFGGSGFLGSHVVDVLLERGYEVVVFDLKPSPYLRKSDSMVVGNILDYKAVDDAVKGADIVYNFAGIADIDEAKINPVETVKQNILGTSIILDVCQRNNIKRFLFASSVYVYSKLGSFYRTSKRSCEHIVEDYQKVYGLRFTIMRYGSLYGPRADKRNWIYSMLKQAVTECKITRQGTGEELREYIHVQDAARMSVDILEEQYSNKHVMITGNYTIKMKDLLIMVKEMLNNKIEIEYVPAGEEEHYEITPYSFSPKIAKKIVSNTCLDLGQGILSVLDGVYNEFLHHNEHESAHIK